MKKKLPKGPDKHDLTVLRLVKANGPMFMTHHARESRAHDLSRKGYLSQKMAVYKMSPSVVEGRNQYTMTQAGLDFLAQQEAACPTK